ncbi:hypothetical protein ANCCAN_23930 [Ancylostoma caninum]|uniref:Uncharacterized protein n=1 Tax=Ancylostoma caninum TaxID=29170 RepID=A0A368FHD6_ANCCA|nr:hypothetical protein ANCCAN_23930 [Ancylostoma caninum]
MRLILMFMLLVITTRSLNYDPFSGKSIDQQRREEQFERCLEICVKDKDKATAKPNQILCSQCPLPLNPGGVFLP